MFKDFYKTFVNGLWEENAIFSLALGLCPALAVTTDAKNGFGMGMALLFVLTLSVMIISILRKHIHKRVRVPFFLVIIAGFVTITDLVMKAYIPPLSRALGIFVPLIVVNCTVLGRVEVFASKNSPVKATADGFGMGVGFTLALIVMGGIRELLGAGTLWGVHLSQIVKPLSPGFSNFLLGYKPAIIMILPPGGFLLIGLLMALIAWYKSKRVESTIARHKGVDPEEVLPPELTDDVTHGELV